MLASCYVVFRVLFKNAALQTQVIDFRQEIGVPWEGDFPLDSPWG
jgi:hypothetical protein